MVITGRIYDILVIKDNVAQIVLRKKMNDKIVPVAITVFGWWKDKALNQQKLKPKDKIKANVYMKSKIWNGKWITDVYFKEIYLIEEAPRPMGSGLFQQEENNVVEDDGFVVDSNSGEVFEASE